MQVWAPRAFAAIDFATAPPRWSVPAKRCCGGSSTSIELTPEQVEYYREHLAEEHLPREQKQFAAVDALALELQDFVDAIRTPRQPRVTARRAATPWPWPSRF